MEEQIKSNEIYKKEACVARKRLKKRGSEDHQKQSHQKLFTRS